MRAREAVQWVLGLGLGVLVAGSADAVTLTVSFSGNITSVPNDLLSGFTVGQATSGSYEIDSLTADIDADPNLGLYLGPANFSYQFGTYVANVPAGGGGDSVLIQNDVSGLDRMGVNASCGVCGPDVNGFSSSNLILALQDSTQSVFSDTSLPMSLMVADFDGLSASISFPGAGGVFSSITSVSVSVPEPGTAPLLGLTVVAVALALRRRA